MDFFSVTRLLGPRLRSPRFRFGAAGREASVLKALVASCLFHALLLGGVIFSFNVRPWNPRPFFVFLGSILQEQDFLVFPLDHSLAALDVPVYETAALLTGRSSPTVAVTKPSFSGQLRSPEKVVWKPILVQESAGASPKGGGASESDLRAGVPAGEAGTPAYVPLRLSPSSPKLWDLRRGRDQ